MQLICDTMDFQLNTETAIALGKFDGVHVGHQALLSEVLKQKAKGLTTCVFTFYPAPAVLFGASDGKELSTREEKLALFERMGIDVVVEYPLNFETAAIDPKEFVEEYLHRRLKVAYIVAGEDVSFGNKGLGNAQLLQTLGEKLGFELQTIPKVCVDGREVSSTLIRQLVEQGDMPKASQMQGMPYSVSGEVVHGRHLGRELGFPTLNLVPDKTKLLPPNGVYFSKVKIGDRVYKGISNVGSKPTVDDSKTMGVETYVYDFEDTIYGQSVCVELLEFRRPEQHFESLEALKKQLQADIAAGSAYECL